MAGEVLSSPPFICERCGKCCVNLPTWDEVPAVLKCWILDFDPKAEALYKAVDPETRHCSYLRMEGQAAVCQTYDDRPRMCVVYRCDEAEAMGLWNREEAPAP
jgi:Fe-S-cluster containining protein